MPKMIAFVSEKGGVGKTMLSSELYASFERTGDDAALVSLDPQYGAESVRRVLEGDGEPDVTIVDTPGYLTADMRRVVAEADVVVVPTRPTALNVEPLVRTVQLVRDLTDAPLLIVVNCDSAFRSAANVFRDWIRTWDGADRAALLAVGQSEAIPAAELLGRSTIDYVRHRRGVYASRIEPDLVAVVDWCRSEAGFDVEGGV